MIKIFRNTVKNQSGYAAIEVIFLVSVIAILSSIVVPKISKGFQVAYTNYVIKNIYGELRFLQAASRITTFNRDTPVEIRKYGGFFLMKSDLNGRQYYKTDLMSDITLREHKLLPGYSFNKRIRLMVLYTGILHDSNSRTSGHINLVKDSVDCKPSIVFDSVGRIRMAR